MNTLDITVTGMTCQHCVQSVGKAIGELPGVTNVDVTLDTGAVSIVSESPIDEAAVAAAVRDAGYQVGQPGDVADSADANIDNLLI